MYKGLRVLALSSILLVNPATILADEGIDVSEWQGDINFNSVKEVGIDSVFIRASEGFDYRDPYVIENYNKARASDMKVGFYHYLTAQNTQEAFEQANFFVSVIQGLQVEMKFALDYEEFYNLSKEEISAIALTFMNRVSQLTKETCVLYASAYYANRNFTDEVAQNYDLWVADWGVSEPFLDGPWRNYAGWQYSDAGRVAGIGTNVDRDLYNGSVYLDNSANVAMHEYTPTQTNDYIYVRVVSGDTLWGIAQKYGSTVSSIVSLNDIKDPSLIYPGQVFKVYTIRMNSNYDHAIANVEGTFNYRIAYGDTLSQIALNYHTTVETLVSINHIQNPNLIYAGQIIRIPN